MLALINGLFQPKKVIRLVFVPHLHKSLVISFCFFPSVLILLPVFLIIHHPLPSNQVQDNNNVPGVEVLTRNRDNSATSQPYAGPLSDKVRSNKNGSSSRANSTQKLQINQPSFMFPFIPAPCENDLFIEFDSTSMLLILRAQIACISLLYTIAHGKGYRRAGIVKRRSIMSAMLVRRST